jgi:NitT/TauT family transport system permease protein
MNDRTMLLRLCLPFLGLALIIFAWAILVHLSGLPDYIFPGPASVGRSLADDWAMLWRAWLVTAEVAISALLLATVSGCLAAGILAQSRWLEQIIGPALITFQVMPTIAIAPLILIYAPTPWIGQLICAWIVTVFPIMLNFLQGLKGGERHQADLLRTYGATRFQMFIYLQVPSALPGFFAGLKVAGGLALVAAVVGEFVAGQAGHNAGLAFRLLEAQYRLNTPRLFACLILLAVQGALIFGATSLLGHLALRNWHESERR